MFAIIISAAEGGIRKHFFDLCDDVSHVKTHCNLIVFPKNQTDHIFEDRKKDWANWKGLDITKNITISDFINFFKVIYFIYKFDIRLVHAHGAKAGIYSRMAKLIIWNLSIIYSPHGGSFHKANQGRMGFLITALEKTFAKLTNKFVFESLFAKTNFQRQISVDEDKITCIRNKVSFNKSIPINYKIANELKSNRSSGNTIITIVGRVRRIKGHDVLAKALEYLNEKTIVYFVGKSDSDFVAEESLLFKNSKIIFWGDESDVNSFYRYSDLVVCPSRAESFGYVPLEAVLAGAKVVVSDIPAFQETLTGLPNVYFFKCAEPPDLVRAIELALKYKCIDVSDNLKRSIMSDSFGKDFNQLYSNYLR